MISPMVPETPDAMRSPCIHTLGIRLSRLSLLTSVALTFGATIASAADFSIPYKALPPAPNPAFSWSGFYLGADVGYSWGRDHLVEYFTATNVFTGFEQKYNPNGVSGGVYAGANYQFGSTVLGFEADFEPTRITGGWSDPLVGGAGDTSINWQGSARGRLGYAVDNVLFYGTGGLAFGKIGHTYTNILTGISETTSSVRTGWTAGAGVEVAFTRNILVRAEYRYTDYGQSRYDSVTSFPGLSGTQEPRFSSVRVGAAYKF